MKKVMIALLCMAAGGSACSSSQPSAEATPARETRQSSLQAEPPVVIYKTTKDYSRHVPVILNDAGTQIISYPAVSDVKIGNKYSYPTPLEDGYLLDNRGIGKNVAFLSYTYEEYAALPSTAELMEKIIDKHPLTEIHHCGNQYQYTNLVQELNERIKADQYSK